MDDTNNSDKDDDDTDLDNNDDHDNDPNDDDDDRNSDVNETENDDVRAIDQFYDTNDGTVPIPITVIRITLSGPLPLTLSEFFPW